MIPLHQVRIALIAVVATCGCTAVGPDCVQDAGTMEAVLAKLGAMEGRIAAYEALRKESGLPFTFYSDQGVVGAFDVPCGWAKSAVCRRVPIPSPGLESEWVYEISPTGRVLGRWRVPMNFVPEGVEDSELLARELWDPAALVLAFRPDGRFRVHQVKRVEAAALVDRDCPAGLSLFSGSAYRGCGVVRDTAGRERWLVFQGPCT